ncbi:MAG: response regulator [Chloroflexota bacterium]|nr:response regulator [Chloroflexota bacterium]
MTEPETNRLVVLLVEDNPGDARLIEEMLRQVRDPRPSLTRVDRLKAAVEHITRHPVDLVLLDLSLPDSTGIDTVIALKHHAPEVPIVVLSGLNDETTAIQAVHQGAQDYLIKGTLDEVLLMRSMRYAVERERTRREVDALKSQIISMVSHELRTPLAHIKGFTSSLLDDEVSWDADTQRDFIQEIDREADRLSELISDILDMSRIESGETNLLERSWQEPAALVRQALQSAVAVTSRHTVINETPAELSPIFVDGPQIERVLVNLIENAAKYSDPGTTIRIGGRMLEGACRFRVADEGQGVPAEYQERIFEKFFRVKTGKPRMPGTGLGLAICKGIVEAHGGHIWVESELDQGARFLFSLPLAGVEEPAPLAAARR